MTAKGKWDCGLQKEGKMLNMCVWFYVGRCVLRSGSIIVTYRKSLLL